MVKQGGYYKPFVPVVKDNKKYRIFKDDIKRIYRVKKLALPPLPAFDDGSEKEESW